MKDLNYIIWASTDVGIKKKANQDSLSISTINTPQGKMVFAVLCDGMGGLAKGEVASASVVRAFKNWMMEDLPSLCNGVIEDHVIKEQWGNIIFSQNQKIMDYGKRHGVSIGTTATVMLITQSRYYILNIGDTRAYEIKDEVVQITEDQTVVAREVKLGNMTTSQAKLDPRRNVLLQCIGVSNALYPEMFFGETKKDAVYMLCSDGFRHEITTEEIYEKLQPGVLLSVDMMKNNAEYLIDLNKQRGENDNISVILVRSF